MPVPNDVTVNRQVLAEPDAALADNTWATLADGTPLVTAERRGKGLIVLFHVTGDTRWSDLPMSGAFVEMLKRIVELAGTQRRRRRRIRQEDHYRARLGARRPACSTASAASSRRPRPLGRCRRTIRRARRPIIRPDFTARRTARWRSIRLRPATGSRRSISRRCARGSRELPQRPSRRICAGLSCLAALALFLLDALIVLFLGGGIGSGCCRASRARGRRRRSSCSPVRGAVAAPRSADGADMHSNVPRSALETKLAYVVTGNADVDSISKAGLAGLTLFLAQRTALEAGDPIGLDLAHDELAFYPLIYWPVVPGAARPQRAGAQAHRRLHETGRHRAVRYPRRHRGAARRRRRNAQPRDAGTAQDPFLARHSRA